MSLHDDEEVMSEINVTPFIDVMLVLLIIFMIVTPLTTSSVHVNLPSTSSNIQKDKAKSLILYLKNTGEMYINEDKTLLVDVESRLGQITNNKKDTTIFFHVDKSVPYENLMKVVNRLVTIGYTKIALTTKKENEA